MKYNLVENAKDSLFHAVEHLTNPDGITSSDYKRAILDIYHGMELLLKERVKQINPDLVWRKCSPERRCSIGALEALDCLLSHLGVKLIEKQYNTIIQCKEIRNNIEHYEFEIEDKKAKGIIGRMLSLIFQFSKTHLQIDFETGFRRDDRWLSLIEIYEFWDAHKDVVENELFNARIPAIGCPYCGANTFVISEESCRMCDHHEEVVECDLCDQEVVKSEIETIRMDDYSSVQNACSCCIEKMRKAQ